MPIKTSSPQARQRSEDVQYGWVICQSDRQGEEGGMGKGKGKRGKGKGEGVTVYTHTSCGCSLLQDLAPPSPQLWGSRTFQEGFKVFKVPQIWGI
jgi:hypothetical protein